MGLNPSLADLPKSNGDDTNFPCLNLSYNVWVVDDRIVGIVNGTVELAVSKVDDDTTFDLTFSKSLPNTRSQQVL